MPGGERWGDPVSALTAPQRHTRKGPADSGTIVVHVPLPGVRRATVDERGVETILGRVTKQKWDRVAGNTPSSYPLGVEGTRTRVVQPQATVLARFGIAPKKHHGFVGR